MARRRTAVAILLIFATFALATSASATVLPPGTPLSPGAPPDPALVIPGGTSLDSTTGSVSSGGLALTYLERVFRDPNPNAACLTGGCITFVIDVANTGADTISRITTSSFAGFAVDAGYYALASGTVIPSSVDRVNADGSVIGFQFANLLLPFKSGTSVKTLIIETSALNFAKIGLLNFTDGGAISAPAFAPTAVPEPASFLLLGSGLTGLGLVFVRGRTKGKGPKHNAGQLSGIRQR